MYAIVKLQGGQLKVEKDQVFTVDRINTKDEKTFIADKVLFAAEGEKYHIGQPYLEGASVECEVLGHKRGPKVIAFKYRERKSSQSKRGHRQELTELKVKDIKLKKAVSAEKKK